MIYCRQERINVRLLGNSNNKFHLNSLITFIAKWMNSDRKRTLLYALADWYVLWCDYTCCWLLTSIIENRVSWETHHRLGARVVETRIK
jgi:hypothetical protein